MEIIRIRTVFKGSQEDIMLLWDELIKLGHQRFKIEEGTPGDPESWWIIDLFLPEMLKYGLPQENTSWKWMDSFLWPWPSTDSLLRPIFKMNEDRIVMFLDINYYGIYYEPSQSSFNPYPPFDISRHGKSYSNKLYYTKILRNLGIPFDVFLNNIKIWPIIDFAEPDAIYEYYFRKTSEV